MMDAEARKRIDGYKRDYDATPHGMQLTFYADKVVEGADRREVLQALKELQQEEQQRLLGRGNAPVKAASR